MKSTVELAAYLQRIPPERRPRFDSIRQLVVELYPQAVESMRYRMPSFEYRQGWIAVANQKSYISVYTCMAKHIDGFKLKHPDIKTGTGCINFRDRDAVPLDDLAVVVSNALGVDKEDRA